MTTEGINRAPSVFDPVRHRHVALTPEEEVRQSIIVMLHDKYGYPFELMQVEGTVSVGGASRRCDIVIFTTDGKPMMIVECKRPNVAITQRVCDQACRYNTALRVPYLLLTNGHTNIVVEVDFEHAVLRPRNDIPHFSSKK